MNVPLHLLKRREGKRSFYAALVDTANTKPNDMDGSTAQRAVPPGHTKSLQESEGRVEFSTGDLFAQIMADYIRGGVYTGATGYDRYQKDLIAVDRLGVEGDLVRARVKARMGHAVMVEV